MYAFAIWVTTKCNMRCSYCYEGNDKDSHFMDKKTADETIKFVIEKINKSDMTIIDFHGGEPLLNFPAIKYIVDKLHNEYRDYKFSFGITTNGTICTPEILEFLSHNFGYSLTVSLDGTKKAHEANRKLSNGRGTYYEALRTAMALLTDKQRCDVRIRMTVVPNNIRELAKGVIELIEKGFKIIIPVIDYFDKNWKQSDIAIIYQELDKIKKYLIKKNKFSEVVVSMVNDKNKILGKCNGGMTSFHITPDGDIYPCAYAVGNSNEKMGDVFQGIDQKKVDVYQKLYLLENEQCIGCGNYNKCASSRCKFLNHSVMGEYTKPIPVLCMIENIKHDISTQENL